MKFWFKVIIINLIVYGIFSFIIGKFDLTEWNLCLRFIFVIYIAFITFLIYVLGKEL